MITEDRLKELESLGSNEAHLFKTELRELVKAYRERPRVVKNESSGAWLLFGSDGKRAAISVECLAAGRGPISAAALREWSDSLPASDG